MWHRACTWATLSSYLVLIKTKSSWARILFQDHFADFHFYLLGFVPLSHSIFAVSLRKCCEKHSWRSYIINIKKCRQCKAGRERFTPYHSTNPQKERRERENSERQKGANSIAQQESIDIVLENPPVPTTEYMVSKIVPHAEILRGNKVLRYYEEPYTYIYWCTTKHSGQLTGVSVVASSSLSWKRSNDVSLVTEQSILWSSNSGFR